MDLHDQRTIDLSKVHSVYEVFTPTTPATLTFVERESVNDRLVDALRMPGMQIVVYGHSGSGKTTLLANKLHQIYEDHVTTRCMKGMSFEQIVLDGFDQLAPAFESERLGRESSSFSAEVAQDYLLLKGKIGLTSGAETSVKHQRVLPPQLTPQALGRFIGEAKSCWVLEDFHKVDEETKVRLAQLMKVFMDMGAVYPSLKIICLGAVDTARQVIQCEPEMKRRVAEILVPLMSEKELQRIIFKGSEYLRIQFSTTIQRRIARYSNGLASVCHNLCLKACLAAGVEKTQTSRLGVESSHFDDGLAAYLSDASDSLKDAFDRAFKPRRTNRFENAKLIIRALTELESDGATKAQIAAQIAKYEKNYPSSNLDYFCKKLQHEEYGGVLRFDSVSGRLSFSDPLYGAFAKAFFKSQSTSDHMVSVSRLDTMVFDIVIRTMKTDIAKGRLMHFYTSKDERREDAGSTDS